MQVDLQKLIKLLNLTTSDQDGEALTAVRMANKMVKAAGMTWEGVLAKSGCTSGRAEQKSNFRSDEIQDMLDDLEGDDELTAWEADFISSVGAWYKTRGKLSEKQEDVLRRIWAKYYDS